jgi:hypothetical protein
MSDENPTADSGASIHDRLMALDAPEPSEPEERDEPQGDEQEPESAEQNTDEPEGGEPEDDQQPQLSTTDFAKVLGIDESMLDLDDEGNAIIKTKIDGKEGTAKFADVLKSYQLQGHIDNKAREVAEQQKAIQARMAEVEQYAQQRVQQLEQLSNIANQELMREYQSIDWQTLRATDPAEYSARVMDFQQRQGQINQLFQVAEQTKAQQQHQQTESYRAMLATEAQRLPELIPEWKDTATADKERKAIKEYGLKAGIDPADLDSIPKAAYVSVLRKAMLYDQLQQSKAVVENKVRTAPKLVKPGQAQQQSRQAQTISNIKSQVKKSGGKAGSVVEYLLATGKV